MATEVQLYIEGDRYMVADILLFRRSQTTNKVSDVILIENKLSSTTRFTSNQSEMFRNGQKAKSLKVKVRSRGKTIKRDEIIPLSSTQLIEIRGNGKTTEVAKATLDIIK